MTDIRSRGKIETVASVTDLNYSVDRNLICGGFKVFINWKYDIKKFPNIIAFKVYKAVLSQSKVKKNYLIDQKAFEKFTSTNSSIKKYNELYNKSLFSQNSSVKFANSNSDKHTKSEGELSNYSFFNLKMVRPNYNLVDYSIEDKNVKFGESYVYYVTALTKDFRETIATPFVVNVEDLTHPSPPKFLEITETDKGLMLIFGNNQDRTISKYKLYKREDSEKDFKLIASIDGKENVSFLDVDIFPKKNYVYRIYSENYFGSLSLSSIEKIGVFKYNPPWSNIEYQPSITVGGDEKNGISFSIKNERPDKIKSVRIERRDDWMFEQSFNAKSYNGFPWENNIFFNEKGIINFIDKNVVKGRVYSYRVTAFNLFGFPVSYFFCNHITPGEQKVFENNQLPKFNAPKLSGFDLDIVSEKQNNVFISCSWKVLGDWSHLILKLKNREIKIENIHSNVFIDGFAKGQKYEMFVELYGLDGKKYGEIKNLILKT